MSCLPALEYVCKVWGWGTNMYPFSKAPVECPVTALLAFTLVLPASRMLCDLPCARTVFLLTFSIHIHPTVTVLTNQDLLAGKRLERE